MLLNISAFAATNYQTDVKIPVKVTMEGEKASSEDVIITMTPLEDAEEFDQTSITVKAKKGETGLAIGNAVGSNIFNLLLILGVSAVIHPVAVNLASLYDMIILIGISVITYIFAITKRNISRLEGICMVIIYIADLVFAAVR